MNSIQLFASNLNVEVCDEPFIAAVAGFKSDNIMWSSAVE